MRILFAFVFGLVLFTSRGSGKKAQSSVFANTTSAAASEDNPGFAQENPVKVDGVNNGGPANERAYLNSLTGPNGETVQFERKGSCWPFKTPNGLINNTGMLDMYQVTYAGLSKPVVIYINTYDKAELKAPKGFLFRN